MSERPPDIFGKLYAGRIRTQTSDDPDETEGRRLYRAYADKLAGAQIAMTKRRVKISEPDAALSLRLALALFDSTGDQERAEQIIRSHRKWGDECTTDPTKNYW